MSLVMFANPNKKFCAKHDRASLLHAIEYVAGEKRRRKNKSHHWRSYQLDEKKMKRFESKTDLEILFRHANFERCLSDAINNQTNDEDFVDKFLEF